MKKVNPANDNSSIVSAMKAGQRQYQREELTKEINQAKENRDNINRNR